MSCPRPATRGPGPLPTLGSRGAAHESRGYPILAHRACGLAASRSIGLPIGCLLVVDSHDRSNYHRAVNPCDPVGLTEIAVRLGVAPQTARAWRARRVLPDRRWTVSGQPAWDWKDIASWAAATGRLAPHMKEGAVMPLLTAEETVIIRRVDGPGSVQLQVRQHLGPDTLDFDLEGQPVGGAVGPRRHVLVFDVTDAEDDAELAAVVESAGDVVEVEGSIRLPSMEVTDIETPAVIRVGRRVVQRRAIGFVERG